MTVIIPNDLQGLTYEDPPLVHDTTHTGYGYVLPAKLPDQNLLHQAADVLNASKRETMLVGAGARPTVGGSAPPGPVLHR